MACVVNFIAYFSDPKTKLEPYVTINCEDYSFRSPVCEDPKKPKWNFSGLMYRKNPLTKPITLEVRCCRRHGNTHLCASPTIVQAELAFRLLTLPCNTVLLCKLEDVCRTRLILFLCQVWNNNKILDECIGCCLVPATEDEFEFVYTLGLVDRKDTTVSKPSTLTFRITTSHNLVEI